MPGPGRPPRAESKLRAPQRAAGEDAGPECGAAAWRAVAPRREPSLRRRRRRRGAGARRPCPCGRGGIAAPREAPASPRPAPERAECGARGAPRPGRAPGGSGLGSGTSVLGCVCLRFAGESRGNVTAAGGCTMERGLLLSAEKGQREERCHLEGELGSLPSLPWPSPVEFSLHRSAEPCLPFAWTWGPGKWHPFYPGLSLPGESGTVQRLPGQWGPGPGFTGWGGIWRWTSRIGRRVEDLGTLEPVRVLCPLPFNERVLQVLGADLLVLEISSGLR